MDIWLSSCSLHTKGVPWCRAQTRGFRIRGSRLNTDPHVAARGPSAKLLELLTLIVLFNGQEAGNTWLLEVLVQVKGSECWESTSSAGGPLAAVLPFIIPCVTHPVGSCMSVTPEGPQGHLSADKRMDG